MRNERSGIGPPHRAAGRRDHGRRRGGTAVLTLAEHMLGAALYHPSLERDRGSGLRRIVIDDDLALFIAGIPKAELHIHLDSVSPDLLLRIARRNQIDLPFTSSEEAERWLVFEDLEDYLQKWAMTTSVLRTRRDYHDIAYEMGRDMSAQNILRREAMFTFAAAHEGRVELEVVLDGLAAGRRDAKRDFDVDLFFIADIDRTMSADRSRTFVERIVPFKDDVGILGVGLDCQEVGYPAGPHRRAFELARRSGLFLSGHGGEEYAAGPEGVWDVIRTIGPDRIDHGNQAIRDDELVDHLVAAQIPLTLCPMSNVALRVYDDVSQHPAIALREKGVFITINSDDQSFTRSSLTDNYTRLAGTFALTKQDIAGLARNGFLASYADDSAKKAYLSKLDNWLAIQAV